VVALEILSKKPVGIGARHGWHPASQAMQATEVRGKYLCQLDGRPAADVFLEYAHATDQQWDSADMLPLFLHNLLGIDFGIGYKLRVPLALQPDGSILYAAEIPPGATVHFMQTSAGSAEDAAVGAAHIAQQKLYGSKPAVALFFDCVATRLRMGREFGFELQAVQDTLGETKYLGCNTHGQIARAEGQLCTFHNCTAVVCLLPA
ncbi:MAG TPA: FIST C-terminal domain-containing protein, partial [Ktedonobacteraceae bacterium]